MATVVVPVVFGEVAVADVNARVQEHNDTCESFLFVSVVANATKARIGLVNADVRWLYSNLVFQVNTSMHSLSVP